MERCRFKHAFFAFLALTAMASSGALACLQSTREACCQGNALVFEESMIRQCRLEDCQFSIDGSSCEHPGSYTQCLQAANCPTPSELEEVAGTLNSASAAEILSDPCVAFPDATECNVLIEWCCNGATVVVDGQAIYLTLVAELSTIVEADFDVVCNEEAQQEEASARTQSWSGQASISVEAPTRDLSCNVSLDVSHIHCEQSLQFTAQETTTSMNRTDRAWAEVSVDLPFRGGGELQVPDSVAGALDAEVAEIFSQVGADDANIPHVDLSQANVEIILDVDAYLDYADVRAAVDSAVQFYGPSFVHSTTTTFSPAGGATTTTTTAASSAAQLILGSTNLSSPSSIIVIAGATAASAVVVIAAVIAIVVVVVRNSSKHRIVRSRSRLAVTSASLEHAHDDTHLNHRHEKKCHRGSRRPSGTQSQKVADECHVFPGSVAKTTEDSSDQLSSSAGDPAVFHKRGASISEITAELADVETDSQRQCEEVITVTDLDAVMAPLQAADKTVVQ